MANVEQEANYIADLYRDAEVFPSDLRQEARELLHNYTNIVINDEWPCMEQGKSSAKAWQIVNKIWALYTKFIPVNENQKIFFTESVDKLNDLFELRRLRLLESRIGISKLLWFILIIGALITISFTFFFGTENLRAHIIMTILLTAVIVLSLLTIMSFDYPFTGGIRISPEPFKQILVFN